MTDNEPPDTVPVDDVIGKLASLGLSPDVIAMTLEAPVSRVRSVLVTRTTHGPSPEEKQLAEEVRQLTHTALRQATLMLQFGHTDQKIAIIKSLLSNAGRLIGQESGGSTEEIRANLETLFTETRRVKGSQVVITDDGAIDVEALDDTPVPPVPPPPLTPRPVPSSVLPKLPPNVTNMAEGVIHASKLKALIESANDQDSGANTTEVRY
jgi:hypothetical protein